MWISQREIHTRHHIEPHTIISIDVKILLVGQILHINEYPGMGKFPGGKKTDSIIMRHRIGTDVVSAFGTIADIFEGGRHGELGYGLNVQPAVYSKIRATIKVLDFYTVLNAFAIHKTEIAHPVYRTA